MKKRRYAERIILIMILFFVMSCQAFTLDSVPYVMSGNFVMEEGSSDYSICGVDFFLLNKSDKEIKKINVVFFLFDQDGEPAYECQSKISAEIDKSIDGGDECSFCMSLDRFMNSIPSEPLMVDYLYLSRIEYEDGSSWEDPYGLVAFK